MKGWVSHVFSGHTIIQTTDPHVKQRFYDYSDYCFNSPAEISFNQIHGSLMKKIIVCPNMMKSFGLWILSVFQIGLSFCFVQGEVVVKPLESPLPHFGAPRNGFSVVPAVNWYAINYINALSEESAAKNRVLINGSGVSVGDFNQDGLPDVFVCGLDSTNRLFQNLGGWKFQPKSGDGFDALSMSGIFSRGSVMADVNGDGWLDILISTVGHGVRLFININGDKFLEKTNEWNLTSNFGSSSLALADVNRDGYLDLYVSNNRAEDIRDTGRLKLQRVNGQIQIPRHLKDRIFFKDGILYEYGEPDRLYINDNGKSFQPVPWNKGHFLDEDGKPLSSPPLDWGLSVTMSDFNGDGLPDIYVCNDFWSPDRLWLNLGKSKFKLLDTNTWRNSSASSMGIDLADLDGDGYQEFFVLDMLSRDPVLRKMQKHAQSPLIQKPSPLTARPQFLRNTLYRNIDGKQFQEMAYYAGLQATDWSWTPIFLDINLDGHSDLIISAGHAHDVQDYDASRAISKLQKPRSNSLSDKEVKDLFTEEMIRHNRMYPDLDMPLISFMNQHDFKFNEMTGDWTASSGSIRHGMAKADFDLDGDMDLVISCLNSTIELHENTGQEKRIAVEIRGLDHNSSGVGASVILEWPGLPNQFREIRSGGPYLSGNQYLVSFATPEQQSGKSPVGKLHVYWPSGKVSIHGNIVAGNLYQIREDNLDFDATQKSIRSDKPMMKDVSHLLKGHRVQESSHDEFQAQPLKPYMTTRRGPGLSWGDVNGDGVDDLFVGDSKVGKPAIFINKSGESFDKYEVERKNFSEGELGAALILQKDKSGSSEILGMLDLNETSQEGALLDISSSESGGYSLIKNHEGVASGYFSAATFLSKTKSMALVTGSGEGEKSFPESSSASLYLKQGDNWIKDDSISALLQSLGLVSSAIWTDINQDGFQDLALASHWGNIHILIQDPNKPQLFFSDRSVDYGIHENKRGLWNGLASGDFNEDGYPDLVATNWGLNTDYQASSLQPLTFFHGQLSQPGIMDIIETEHDPAGTKLLMRRHLPFVISSLPYILSNVRTARQYAEASVEKLLGNRIKLAKKTEITLLSSSIFLSDGGKRFISRDLPVEAQLSPAFGLGIADFDGDGHEDLFLAQNFFGTRVDLDRSDAGLGLFLLGDGEGQFSSLNPGQSGILLQGEQRAVVVGDFNADSKADLAVSQNNSEVKLFQNISEVNGYSLRLVGSSENPAALGASFQLVYSNGQKGPLREIQAGHGILSQSSMTSIVHPPKSTQIEGAALRVRWPGNANWESKPLIFSKKKGQVSVISQN